MANQSIGVYLPEELAMRLAIFVAEGDKNRNKVINRAIEELLDREEKK